MQLWLCGQCKSGEKLESIIWEFQGIYSTRTKAVAACRNSNYFICPVTLDEELLDETMQMPDTEYPICNDVNSTTKNGGNEDELLPVESLDPPKEEDEE